MHTYLVVITMADGSTGEHNGLYVDGFAACICALENFPDAKRIFARRLS